MSVSSDHEFALGQRDTRGPWCLRRLRKDIHDGTVLPRCRRVVSEPSPTTHPVVVHNITVQTPPLVFLLPLTLRVSFKESTKSGVKGRR